ncbi:MAG: TolB family protein [Ilumatobacter sp.]
MKTRLRSTLGGLVVLLIATTALVAVTAAASSSEVGYRLTIGPEDVGQFTLLNESANAQIVEIEFRIGDTRFFFDSVAGFDPLIDTNAPIVATVVRPDPNIQGDLLQPDDDLYEIAFTGFDPLDEFEFFADVDFDGTNSFVADVVYFGNGAQPNGSVTVTFSTGEQLTQTFPESPEIVDGAVAFEQRGQSCDPRILVVAGSATPPAGDRSLLDAVSDATSESGCVVIVSDDDVTQLQAEMYDVVVIASSVQPSVLTSRLRDAVVPILVSEPALFDDMSMVPQGGRGEQPSVSSVRIADPDHPLAGGLSGRVKVFASGSPVNFGKDSAAPGAEVAATVVGNSNRMTIFGFDAGRALTDRPAPARRVGFFASYAAELTTDGDRLVAAAIDWLAAQTESTARPKALLVAGNANPPRKDLPIADRVGAAGLELFTVADDDVGTVDPRHFAAIFISSSVDPVLVGDTFRDAPVPVVVWEGYLFDDMALSASGETTRDRVAVTVVEPGHPLAAGLPAGNAQVYTSAEKLSFGMPAPAATVVAHEPGHPDRAVIFGYNTGDVRADGSPTPAPRLAMFPSFEGAGVLTSGGVKLIEAGIDWALGRPQTRLVSTAASGGPSDGDNFSASISDDGGLIAFESYSRDLVPGGSNGDFQVFLHDTRTGANRQISLSASGEQGDGGSFAPVISGDGNAVAFYSDARNLVGVDTNLREDVFVHDIVSGLTTMASVSSHGTQGDDTSNVPSISANGSVVAFQSFATNLVADDTNAQPDIFVRDAVTGTTSRVSVSSTGEQGDRGAFTNPAISADGRFVAFGSESTNLVAGDSNGVADVFVHDRITGVTTRVSMASDATESNGSSHLPAISADGQIIAFASAANNLVADDTNGAQDIFVHDTSTATTTRVSIATDGTAANGGSSVFLDVSADGDSIAFASWASNLVADDANGESDVFVHSRQTASTVRASVSSMGTESDGHSFGPSISGSGEFVVFRSNATTLVSDDTGGRSHVFSHGPIG